MSKKGFKQENIEMGQRIRVIREGLDMTQEQFAEFLGITASAVKKLEAGANGISRENLKKLVDKNYSADFLLFGKQEPFDKTMFEIGNCTPSQKLLLLVKLCGDLVRRQGEDKLSKDDITKLLAAAFHEEA